MNEDPKRREETEAEGWESLAEESAGSLAPNPELEEALREAAEAVEAREQETGEGGSASVQAVSDQLAETMDRYLRLQADFENFRRRVAKDREELLQYGYQNLVKDLLSTVDNLDRAIEHVRKGREADFESLLEGVELVRKDLLSVLSNWGVAEIEAQGSVFDPNLHEAMAQVPHESAEPNSVLEVLQKGYQLRERLIRPARVVVAARPSDDADESDSESGKGEAAD